MDLCYHNFKCARPWFIFSDFNHVISNISYVIFGLFFMHLCYLKTKQLPGMIPFFSITVYIFSQFTSIWWQKGHCRFCIYPSLTISILGIEISSNINDLLIFKREQSLITLFFTDYYGILLPKLFWPTVKKKCSSDRVRGWRPRISKKFEITRTIYSNIERSEKILVAECFFNFLLEVSHVS